MKVHKQELIYSLVFFFHLLLHLSTFVYLSSASGPSGENPFTPKAYAIRYWNNKIYKVPRPEFLLKKASPLSASDSARFTQLASTHSLSTHLHSFCKLANLLCFPDPTPSLSTKHSPNDSFSNYNDYTFQNFTNYATGEAGGLNSFKNYSEDLNEQLTTFRRYSRDSAGHKDDFTNYDYGENVPSRSFNSYASGATGGSSKFSAYDEQVNIPGLQFASYSDEANGRDGTFSSYSHNTNVGQQGFANYGKNGNGLTNSFVSYANSSNIVGSTFSGYSKSGNSGNDEFIGYGDKSNLPQNNFSSYADGGNAGVESFVSYKDETNAGDDVFKSYAKNSNNVMVKFSNYDDIWDEASHNFTGYGTNGAKGQQIGFKSYQRSRSGQDSNFKNYAKKGVTFADYKKTSLVKKGKFVSKWMEAGKFFREKMLKQGTVMPMPDVRDKMPKRSFLPRSILSKIPFSSSNITQLKEMFHAIDDSTMVRMLNAALRECERAPSEGETKKCVGSMEDMIDFAVSVLGRTVAARTTENVNGSKTNILIGKVRGINRGKVTKSVSCHQSLYPYLLYYCHSVPKVRVYEADILDPNTKAKINHGVAICHLDTSAWSSTHGAFLALGPGPGKIEVCHWIFENDLTWTVA